MLRTMAESVANACWAMLMFWVGVDSQTSNTIIAVASDSGHENGMGASMDDPAGDAAAALSFYGGN